MTWQELEKIFNRALHFSFSKKKWLLVFPVLALCGFLAVIFRTISLAAGPWVQMSLAFLPIFLCAALLLGMGIVLTQIYHREVKGFTAKYTETIKGSTDLFIGIIYLAVPLIFAYLVLWMFLGIFYLLRAIPSIGEVVGAILSFGPFLLVLAALVLGLLNLLILFYITPAAALKSEMGLSLAKDVFQELKANPFLSFVIPLIALLPLLLTVGILSAAAVLTHVMYVEGEGISVALKWFFMMVPFCALLTPAVIFFFNFSAESYVLIRKEIACK